MELAQKILLGPTVFILNLLFKFLAYLLISSFFKTLAFLGTIVL